MAWPSGKAEACKASIPSSNLGATFMLYLVATPIGNLGDITLRAIETLKSVSYILCEDTRYTRPMCAHFGIATPLKSYHKFNEKKRAESILADLKNGLHIALISDAGTPGISDPGADLVTYCIEEKIPVQSIPGACALIVALTCSGFETHRFQFRGFLPRKKGELKEEIVDILQYKGTTVCYESPLRLLEVLNLIHSLAPSRRVGVARELTKKFEEVVRGVAQELIDYYTLHPLKGEVVLLIEANREVPWLGLSEEEHVALLEKNYALTRQDAIKMASEQRGVPKRLLYNKLMKKET